MTNMRGSYLLGVMLCVGVIPATRASAEEAGLLITPAPLNDTNDTTRKVAVFKRSITPKVTTTCLRQGRRSGYGGGDEVHDVGQMVIACLVEASIPAANPPMTWGFEGTLVYTASIDGGQLTDVRKTTDTLLAHGNAPPSPASCLQHKLDEAAWDFRWQTSGPFVSDCRTDVTIAFATENNGYIDEYQVHGNGNQRLDRGEVVSLQLSVRNITGTVVDTLFLDVSLPPSTCPSHVYLVSGGRTACRVFLRSSPHINLPSHGVERLTVGLQARPAAGPIPATTLHVAARDARCTGTCPTGTADIAISRASDDVLSPPRTPSGAPTALGPPAPTDPEHPHLCAQGDIVYFNCRLKEAGQLVSLCGRGLKTVDALFYYRTGLPNNIELEVASTTSPRGTFKANFDMSDAGWETFGVNVRHSRDEYNIGVETRYDANGRKQELGRVYATRGLVSGMPPRQDCRLPLVTRLDELNASLADVGRPISSP